MAKKKKLTGQKGKFNHKGLCRGCLEYTFIDADYLCASCYNGVRFVIN